MNIQTTYEIDVETSIVVVTGAVSVPKLDIERDVRWTFDFSHVTPTKLLWFAARQCQIDFARVVRARIIKDRTVDISNVNVDVNTDLGNQRVAKSNVERAKDMFAKLSQRDRDAMLELLLNVSDVPTTDEIEETVEAA